MAIGYTLWPCDHFELFLHTKMGKIIKRNDSFWVFCGKLGVLHYKCQNWHCVWIVQVAQHRACPLQVFFQPVFHRVKELISLQKVVCQVKLIQAKELQLNTWQNMRGPEYWGQGLCRLRKEGLCVYFYRHGNFNIVNWTLSVKLKAFFTVIRFLILIIVVINDRG